MARIRRNDLRRRVGASRPALLSVLGVVGTYGCPTPECPMGLVRVGERCVESDDAGAVRELDASRSASDVLDGQEHTDGARADASRSEGAPDASLPDVSLEPDGCTPLAWYADTDGDGHGDPAVSVVGCGAGPVGFVASSSDCDDACATCFPGSTEVCDGRDQDCDGTVDEGVRTMFVVDCDRDGFTRAGAETTLACSVPESGPAECPSGGWRAGASSPADCDDACMACRPGGTEVCDGRDQDCDGTVDEGVLLTFYRDCDGDGFTPTSPMTTRACSAPSSAPSACPAGSWRSAPSAMADCWDQDNRAFPGQTAYFTTPLAGRPASVDFDFDCNGIEERLDRTTGGECPHATSTGVCGVNGWVGTTVPDCGVTGSYVECRTSMYIMSMTYTCSGGPFSRVQSCR